MSAKSVRRAGAEEGDAIPAGEIGASAAAQPDEPLQEEKRRDRGRDDRKHASIVPPIALLVVAKELPRFLELFRVDHDLASPPIAALASAIPAARFVVRYAHAMPFARSIPQTISASGSFATTVRVTSPTARNRGAWR